MSNNSIKFTIDLNGNAYKGILQIDDSLKGVLNSVDSARSAFKKLGDASVRFEGMTLIYFTTPIYRIYRYLGKLLLKELL